MVTAGTALTMVVVALRLGVIRKFICDKIIDSLVRTAGNSAVEDDTRLGQCLFGTAADTAAD